MVLGLYGAFAQGDVDRAFAGLDPQTELDLSRRKIDPGTFRGHEAVRDLLCRQREVWSSERLVEPGEYIAVAENVVVVAAPAVA